jgi:DNA-directed RNA polymerase subunit F
MSEEKYLTLAEVEKMLAEEAETRQLSDMQRKTLEHARRNAKATPDKSRALVAELMELKLGDKSIGDALAVKIADVMPQDEDSVRAVFYKERLTLDKKQVEMIIASVKKYLKSEE